MTKYPEVMWCNRDDDMIHFGELQSVAADDVQYLRADTCVSKEKLEKLIKDMKEELHRNYPNHRDYEEINDFVRWMEWRLREVMK